MRAQQFALRRSKRRRGRSILTKLLAQRTRGGLAPLHAGDDSVRRAQTDIMGPDMGTNEQVMAWFMDTYSVYQGYSVSEIVTGKPVAIGGTEGRREVNRTRRRLPDRACDGHAQNGSRKIDRDRTGIRQRRLSGSPVVRLKIGVKVIGISDAHAAIYNPKGIDVKPPNSTFLRRGRCGRLPRTIRSTLTHFWIMPCDILGPAAVDRVINGKKRWRLKCRILARGANGPTTPEADLILEKRWDEVFVIPDILCNAGGVIVSYFEWVQGFQAFLWTETEVTDKLFRILEHSFAQVIKRAKAHKISHRTAAMAIGVERVLKAKKMRGLFP